MDREILITAESTVSGKPLQISISGGRLELLGFAPGKTVAIEEESGKITVRVLCVEESQPVMPVQQAVPAEQVAPAVPAEQSAPVHTPVEETIPETFTAPAMAEKQLFERLSAIRKQLAAENKLPPYIIFHDKALKDMCRLLPVDTEAMKDVYGAGEGKIAKYGARFIEAIRQHMEEYGMEGAA